MNPCKKRNLKHITGIIITLLFLIFIIILKLTPYKEFPYKPPFKAKISAIKGDCYLIKHKNKIKLELNKNFKIGKDIFIKLEDKAKLTLEYTSRLKILYKGPLFIDTNERNKSLIKWASTQWDPYYKAKNNYYLRLNYFIVTLVILIIWILFIYYKNYIFLFSILNTIVSCSFTLFLIDMIKTNVVQFSPISYLFVNIFLIVISFFVFEKNIFIPETFLMDSKASDLILDGFEFYKKKDYNHALILFKKAITIDPERYDIAKMIKVLETKIKNPTKLPLLINFKNRILKN